MLKMKRLCRALLAASCLVPALAYATNGYFAHGYGQREQGMGGVSIAVTGDTMGGANNPATMVFAGNRFDLGLAWFVPDRSASRVGTLPGTPFAGAFDGSQNGNDTKNFFIPEFGYNYMIQPNLSLGITIYGNGGMNTNYPPQLAIPGCAALGGGNFSRNLLCGFGNLGVNLEQLIIAPTLAYKITETQAVGIAPLFGYQRFSANGLQAFSQLSNNPFALTNNGNDQSTGWGVRLGYYGKFGDMVAVGAQYSSKMKMSNFEKYAGLFANQGEFDIPEYWGLGASVTPLPGLLIAFDWERINYGGVPSIANSSVTPGCVPNPPQGPALSPVCLGGASGLGFGWSNINAYKIGVEYKIHEQWTVRAGYDHSDDPISPVNVTFNILAPGVVQNHVTVGATYSLDKSNDITAAYWHGFSNSVTGPTSPYFPVGGFETITLSEDSFGIAWGKKF
jgi:long-chain fatty acid transport protein